MAEIVHDSFIEHVLEEKFWMVGSEKKPFFEPQLTNILATNSADLYKSYYTSQKLLDKIYEMYKIDYDITG